MFDFAWSEIALIGVVALIAIGPKDLPVAIKAVADVIKKARRMAGEFQTHVDEMVREANLHEVRDTIADIRRMDIKGKILDAVDSDGGLRKTIADKPFDINPAPPPVPVADSPAVAAEGGLTEGGVTEAGRVGAASPASEEDGPAPAAAEAASEASGPPAFIPPAIAEAGLPTPPAPPPAFVPPAAVAQAAGARRTPLYG